MIDHCLQFLDEFNKDMEHPYQGSALPLSYNSIHFYFRSDYPYLKAVQR